MQFTDAVAVAGTRRTADGFLVGEARAVRTGIQLYLGSEVGMADKDVVRVYRPAEEVFADASLQSASHMPITVDHPQESVTADNWKTLAAGEVSTLAKKDGEWVQFPLILKDAAAIAAFVDGKREVSAGYTCVLDWTPGTTADGEAYDARQTQIKFNHLALVDRARAGSKARIGDGAIKWGAAPITDTTPEKDTKMTLKTVTVDGIPIEVTDQGATVIATLQQRLTDAKTASDTSVAALNTAIATKDAELAKKDAEIDALKAKVVDGAALDKLVADRAALVNVAKTIAADVKVDGLNDADIRKAVVVAKLGDAAVAGKPAAYIDARFDILAEAVTTDSGVDPFRAAVVDGLKAPAGDLRAQAAAAQAARNQQLRDGWKQPVGEA